MSNFNIMHLPFLRVTNHVDGGEIELEPIDSELSMLYVSDGENRDSFIVSDEFLDGIVSTIETFKKERKRIEHRL